MEVAVGQVDRGNEAKRNFLQKLIARYMAKNNQAPTMRRREHLFGTRISTGTDTDGPLMVMR